MQSVIDFIRQAIGVLLPTVWASWQTVFWLALILFILFNLAFNLAAKNFILSVLGVNEIVGQLQKTLTPPKPDSWQTLLWISVFSWAMSILPISQFVQGFIASCGWLFLIPGVHWFTHEEKLKIFDATFNVKKALTIGGLFLGPWITGALVCIFIFFGIFNAPFEVALLCWPTISAAIAAMPKFIGNGPIFKKPDPGSRQEIVNLILGNLLLSCWFQFYFLTQSWLQSYPSLLTEDFSKSSFVIKLRADDTARSRGLIILEQAAAQLREQLDGKSWPQVERWLYDLKQQLQTMQTTILETSNVEENHLWHLDGRTLPRTEYTVQLFAVWQGPTVNGIGYYLTKNCQVTRVLDSRLTGARTAIGATQIARVSCDATTGPTAGQPVPAV